MGFEAALIVLFVLLLIVIKYFTGHHHLLLDLLLLRVVLIIKVFHLALEISQKLAYRRLFLKLRNRTSLLEI